MLHLCAQKENLAKWCSDIKVWDNEKYNLIFRNKHSLDNYQNNLYKNIKAYYCHTDKTYKSNLNPCLYDKDTTLLRTSGSQSSLSRSYRYSNPQYLTIENHHWWRIEESHGLTDSGLILDFCYVSSKDTIEPYLECYVDDKVFCYPPVGIHNTYKLFYYRRNTNHSSLISSLKEMQDLNPKIIMCSPSQLEFLYLKSKGEVKFNCPLVTTRETLHPHVRNMGLKMFPKIINKMRCWDGGLTFYECNKGVLHICDELSLVEELADHKLASTDFFNFATPFINYLNGDCGIIEQKLCECGVYGNVFKIFHGRTTSVIKIGDYVITGSLIVEDVNSLFKYGGCSSQIFSYSMNEKYNGNPFVGFDIVYSIRQNKNGNIDFFYHSCPKFTDLQKNALLDGLNFIFFRKLGSNLKTEINEENYVVKQDFFVTIKEDVQFINETKGLRNKRQCVESEYEHGK